MTTWTFDPVNLPRQRIARNQNALFVITGQTGSGKSMCSLELCRLLDPLFTTDHVVFRVSDFLEKVQAIIEADKVCRERTGETIDRTICRTLCFEEAGVDLDSRRSGSNKNVDFSNVMKLFRYLQVNVVFNLPNLMMLDKNVRRLFHYHIKTVSINYRNKLCKTRWMIVDSEDDWGDKIKRYFPRIEVPETRERIKLSAVYFHLPPKAMIADYQAKKEAFVEPMLEKMKEKWSAYDAEDAPDVPANPAPKPERPKRTRAAAATPSAFAGDPFFDQAF